MDTTTPREVYHGSTFRNGRFADGTWFCACNMPTAERTSTVPHSKDLKFWRCQNFEKQCSFFLWWEHEARARQSMAEAVPQPPQTPTHRPIGEALSTPPNSYPNAERKRSLSSVTLEGTSDQRRPTTPPNQPAWLPTPDSKPIMQPGRDAAPRAPIRRSPEASPTRKRTRNSSPPSDGDTELSVAVRDLLQSSQVHLSPSTGAELHHKINTEMGVYKARLQQYERTALKLRRKLDELVRKLDELDRARSVAGPST